MASEVVQVRMPKNMIKNIEKLVQSGLYKNKSEVIIDAMRHYLGFNDKDTEIAAFVRLGLIGKSKSKTREINKSNIEKLWMKVRNNNDWKKVFGKDADSVMSKLRGRV